MSYLARNFFALVRDGERLAPRGADIWTIDRHTGREVASGFVTYHAPSQDWEYRKQCHATMCHRRGEELGRVPDPNPAHVMWHKAGGPLAREGRPEDVTPEMWQRTRQALREIKEMGRAA